MPPDTRLADTAQHLLDNIATLLDDAGIDVPEQQYIHAGKAAHDFRGLNCADSLVVSWTISSQGEIGVGLAPGAIRCSVPLAASFTVELTRCVPTLRTTAGGKAAAPTAAELTASAEQIMQDAMTLAKVVVEAALAKTILPDEFATVAIGQISAIGPQGGVGGTLMTLFVNLVGVTQ